MSSTVISVEKLGKEYVIGRNRKGETFREMLVSAVTAPFEHLRGRASAEERIWALKDVNFKVKEGEMVGIIGRNGAGKSTLLKILSRITDPTTGRAALRGRVSSLLEVGTGFHPELTGRENIYVNGAVLGMSRAEINRKLDEIIDFSGVEKFIDMAVKRYSSGMLVRLAFAVAAHLEPEVLVVDEVLAVGDLEFQRKCLGKMSEVTSGGRTVLLVSHNMAPIRALCGRVMVMRAGCIEFDGEPDQAIAAYLADVDQSTDLCTEWTWLGKNGSGNSDIRVRRLRLIGEWSNGPAFRPDEEITVAIEYEQTKRVTAMRIELHLVTLSGEIAFGTTDESVRSQDSYPAGVYVTRCTIPRNLLNCRPYLLRIKAGTSETIDVGRLLVDGVGNDGSIDGQPGRAGVVSPKVRWEISFGKGTHERAPQQIAAS